MKTRRLKSRPRLAILWAFGATLLVLSSRPARAHVCGDGSFDGTDPAVETCDGTANPSFINPPASHGPCRPTGDPCGQCKFCGDGIVQSCEQCDDGNADDNDACRNDCTLPSSTTTTTSSTVTTTSTTSTTAATTTSTTTTAATTTSTTTTSGPPTTTTTVTSTTSTTLPASCGNGTVDPGEECDPPGASSPQCPGVPPVACQPSCQCCVPSPEAGHCNDMIDNDCDAKIDCTDPDCAPARCEGGTQDGQDCSTDAGIIACTNGGGVCHCPAIQKDPTTIKFGPPSAGLDRLKSHGRVVIPGNVDVMAAEVGWLVTNGAGRIFGVVLPAGALTPNHTGTQFRYLNPSARSQGGVYSAFIHITRKGTSYGYKVEAYGDMSAAIDPDMAIQFYVGNQETPAIHHELWSRTASGWKAHGFE